MSDYPKIEVPKNCCDGKKNEDAKKIKELLDDGCFDCCTNQYPVSRDSVKEVWAIAERMAAEIEQLKEEVNETQTVYYSVLKDNTRLKAELEKRPAVVYCKDCIYKNQCKAAVIFQESTSKIEGPFKFYYLKFCSYAQRRENEVKK